MALQPPGCTDVDFAQQALRQRACTAQDFEQCSASGGERAAAELIAPHRGALEPLASELIAPHQATRWPGTELTGPHQSTRLPASELTGPHKSTIIRAAELEAPHSQTQTVGTELEAPGRYSRAAAELLAPHKQGIPLGTELVARHREGWIGTELTARHKVAWIGAELIAKYHVAWTGSELVARYREAWTGSELVARHRDALIGTELVARHREQRFAGAELASLHRSDLQGAELESPHKSTVVQGTELIAPHGPAWTGAELIAPHRTAWIVKDELEALYHGHQAIIDELTAPHEAMGWRMLRIELRAPHRQTWLIGQELATAHSSAWIARQELIALHAQGMSAGAELEAPHQGLALCRTELIAPHSGFDLHNLAIELAAPHLASDRQRLALELIAPHRSEFDPDEDPPPVDSDGLSVTWQGQRLDPIRLSITESRQQATIEAEFELADAATWRQIRQGQQVDVALWGYAWHFIVDGLSRRETFETTSYTVNLASPAALLDFPDAEPVEGELTGQASALAQRLAGSLAVDWQAVNWRIGPGRWIANGESPLALLQTLVTACGAVLLSKRDGSLLVQPQYAVSVPDWAKATPALEIEAASSLISIGTSGEQRDGFDAVTVSDEADSAAGDEAELRLIEDSETRTETTTEMLVYQIPWTGNFTLTHRGDSARAKIVDLGMEEPVITEEEVIIESGGGRSSLPIYAVLSAKYNARNLGSVTYSESGELQTAVEDESILLLTYRTRRKRYRVSESAKTDLLVVASDG